MVILITVMIACAMAEIFLRILIGYEYPLIILQCEFIVIGGVLYLETITFLSLSRRIFEGEFKEEQRFFKVSLAAFLTTYTLRSILLMLVLVFWTTYVNWY